MIVSNVFLVTPSSHVSSRSITSFLSRPAIVLPCKQGQTVHGGKAVDKYGKQTNRKEGNPKEKYAGKNVKKENEILREKLNFLRERLHPLSVGLSE